MLSPLNFFLSSLTVEERNQVEVFFYRIGLQLDLKREEIFPSPGIIKNGRYQIQLEVPQFFSKNVFREVRRRFLADGWTSCYFNTGYFVEGRFIPSSQELLPELQHRKVCLIFLELD